MTENSCTDETAGKSMATHEESEHFPNIDTTACLNLKDDNKKQDQRRDPDTEMVDENAAINYVIALNLNSNSFQQDSGPVHNSGIAISAHKLQKRKLRSVYRLGYLKKSKLQVSSEKDYSDTSLPSTSSSYVPLMKRRRSRFVSSIPVQLGANFQVAGESSTNQAPTQTMVSFCHKHEPQGHGRIQNIEVNSSANLQDDIQKKDSGHGLDEDNNRPICRPIDFSNWVPIVVVKKEPTSDDDDQQQVFDSVEMANRDNIYPNYDNGTQQQNLGNARDVEIACGAAVPEDLDDEDDTGDDVFDDGLYEQHPIVEIAGGAAVDEDVDDEDDDLCEQHPDVEIADGAAVDEDVDDEDDTLDDDLCEQQDPNSDPVTVNRTQTSFPLSGINNQRSEITENPFHLLEFGMLRSHGWRNITAEVHQAKPLIILNATTYRSPPTTIAENILFANACFRSLLSEPYSLKKENALFRLYKKSKMLQEYYSSRYEF